MATDKSDAYILSKEGKFVVWPPVAGVDPGEAKKDKPKPIKFQIRNSMEYHAAMVTLPASRIEDGDARSNREKTVEPGQSASFVLKRINGPFEYVVMVGDQRATAASDPVIIIDPPCA